MSDQISHGWPQPPQPPRRRRKGLLTGVAIAAGAVVVAGASFGAVALFGGTGKEPSAQPAEALPASTFAYASVDTAPSGGEILSLATTLAKFPAVTKNLSLSGGSTDPRKLVFDAIEKSDPQGVASCHLSWDADLAPWMGTKFAVAGVLVDNKPEPVAVVQVTDTAKATAAITKFEGCDHDDAFGLSGNWLLYAPEKSVIDAVKTGVASGTLADDATYQHWTGEAGDPGLVTAYAAPSAGAVIANAMGSMSDPFTSSCATATAIDPPAIPSPGAGSFTTSPSGASVTTTSTDCGETSSAQADLLQGVCPGAANANGRVVKSYQTMLRGFGGAAANVRVRNGGVEVESAIDLGTAASPAGAISGSTTDGAQLVTGLPADTSAAVGVSVAPSPWENMVKGLAQVCGSSSTDKIDSYLGGLTGLTFPGDIDTLLGKGLALSIGPVDANTFEAAGNDPSQIPVALQLDGDAAGIQKVVGKIIDTISSKAGVPVGSVVGVDTNGERVAVGPSSAYRQHVLGGSGLGADPTFKNAVPDADKASSILYVDLDRFDSLVKSDDATAFHDYYQPLQAVGLAGWIAADHTSHTLLRVTTD